jgi:hypothetical protein
MSTAQAGPRPSMRDVVYIDDPRLREEAGRHAAALREQVERMAAMSRE